MRRKYILSAGIATILCLAGCGGTISQLSDSSSPIVTVGNVSIKKGDAYNKLMGLTGAYTAISDAKSVISAAEIPDSDEITAAATTTLANYKKQMGDRFNAYLETIGMTEDEYLSDVLIPSVKNAKLAEKYVSDNFDDVVDKFKPVIASVITVSSEDLAKSAASELANDGSDPSAVATNVGGTASLDQVIVTANVSDNDTTYDSAIRDYLADNPTNTWATVNGSDGNYYVVKKFDTEVSTDNISTIAADSSVTNDAMSYYFKKYGFEVYDSTLYKQIQNDYPEYLADDKEK